jgi:hypothetical protein
MYPVPLEGVTDAMTDQLESAINSRTAEIIVYFSL